jgi:hypothetical protein
MRDGLVTSKLHSNYLRKGCGSVWGPNSDLSSMTCLIVGNN